MRLRELDKKFTRKGVEYRQLYKSDKCFVYECKAKEGYVYYELFERKLSNPHPLSKESYDMIELYPNDNAFGLWAWCITDRQRVAEKAMQTFGEEIKEEVLYEMD